MTCAPAKEQKVGKKKSSPIIGRIPHAKESDIICFGHETDVCSAVVISEWLL
jgi:hypothetical protein